MNISIFLDDERFPPLDGGLWTLVRNYDDFTWFIQHWGIPEIISFDYDLGLAFSKGQLIWEKQQGKTGYDCAKYLIDFMLQQNCPQKIKFKIHSQNPIGSRLIFELLDNWNNTL